MLSRIFGANWQTTIWGGIFAVATAVSVQPVLIEPLPDAIEGYVKMFCFIVVAASGVKFAVEAKSKNVTGGTTQQTANGNVAAAGTASRSMDQTVMASIKSGESVTPEQRESITPANKP